ncbi:MAG: translation initiation factor IF-3 [Deltaproteobacteria bacterium]|nr:translation initiation factor IF-3 [Deltaproteobacteria bacterium]MCX7952281.1 translation initiation factor IF-3 [Deltaproteobacteria bacterium]
MSLNYRVNRQIKAHQVRVVDTDGKQLGIMKIDEALSLAEEKGLDLVEVAPNATPPVCKILDYGKFKYMEQKKEAQARKKRSVIEVKEIRLRYNTDVGDLETKIRLAEKFLDEGNKVRFNMRFKGRELNFNQLGQKKLDFIVERLSSKGTVESRTEEIQGRQLVLVIQPIKKK